MGRARADLREQPRLLAASVQRFRDPGSHGSDRPEAQQVAHGQRVRGRLVEAQSHRFLPLWGERNRFVAACQQDTKRAFDHRIAVLWQHRAAAAYTEAGTAARDVEDHAASA